MINRDERSKDGSSRGNGALLYCGTGVKVLREISFAVPESRRVPLSLHRDVLIIDVGK